MQYNISFKHIGTSDKTKSICEGSCMEKVRKLSDVAGILTKKEAEELEKKVRGLRKKEIIRIR